VAHEMGHYFDFANHPARESFIDTIAAKATRLNWSYRDNGLQDAYMDLVQAIKFGYVIPKFITTMTFEPLDNRSFKLPEFTTIEEYIAYMRSVYPHYLRSKANETASSFKLVWGFIAKKLNATIFVPIQMEGTSQFYTNSKKMKSSYWSKPSELFARAFECYVFDKLAEKGMENNYLVSGTYFNHSLGIYPGVEERKIFNGYFDAIFAIMKSKNEIGSFIPVSNSRANEYIEFESEDEENTDESGVVFEATQESEIISYGIDNKNINNTNNTTMTTPEALEIIETALPTITTDNDALQIMSDLANAVKDQTDGFTNADKISPDKVDITAILSEKKISVERWKEINAGDMTYSERQAVTELADNLLEMMQADADANAELEIK
jgi:hypothetical protein